MPIEKLLNNLIKLQSVDKEIFDLKGRIGEIPEKLRELDSEFETINSGIKKKEDELKGAQLKCKEKEIDLKEKETTIKKYQAQLYQIKTNTEYKALEKEIGGLEADKSVLEECILEVFDEIEKTEEAVRGEKKLLHEEEKRINAAKEGISSEKNRMEKELIGMEEKRKAITPLIDKDTLLKYEKILNNKAGVALVPVKGENCGGCFVYLRPQVINEIRLKENIIYCERCLRMLFLEDE
ncbi:MAG: C4-type zinc ribbon domain-containing protein [Candidatus Omnitrophota bacterium]|nr:C4-type zinc ribbon domain-containing protein [Candidatus Omnitrophota bacterium]